jgi:(p)ppGpp synthase/HD superfamily hydrolase
MDDLEKNLSDMILAPYIFKAMALIAIKRRAGSNMFRHQMITLGILIDYKLIDPILLKAAVIHDLFEDAAGMPGVSREEIISIDQDGQAVYDLVMEVTRRSINGFMEPKPEYLLRIMTSGSQKARILKLADRISNMFDLGFVHEDAFFKKYIEETKHYILPYAEHINSDMFRELSDLVNDRENKLTSRH